MIKTKKINYNDVVVYVNENQYIVSKNHAFILIYTRSGGWELWYKWEGKEELLGGESEGKPFCITIDDYLIFGHIPKTIIKSEPLGWNGEIEAK